jgi:hypothetical protein
MELSGTTRQVPILYLTAFHPLLVSRKLTGTLSGFIARVKPVSSGLMCAWREVLILRQQIAPYMSGRVVDRGSDSTIESFVVHPPVYRTSGALYCLGCFKFWP